MALYSQHVDTGGFSHGPGGGGMAPGPVAKRDP